MNWLTALGAAAAAIVAVAAVAGVAWKVARPHVVALIEDVANAKADAHRASKELQPNSGRSARDQINALHSEVRTLSGKVVSLSHADALRSAELSAIRAGVSYTGRALDRVLRDLDHLESMERNRNDV